MIVETSAMVAIIAKEPERSVFIESIRGAAKALLSTANYLETAVVLDRTRDLGIVAELDLLVASLELEIVAVTPQQGRIAREAHRAFGRGSGHPARLNFGDCFAYALAKETGEPLLFKGDDFSKTDVRAVPVM